MQRRYGSINQRPVRIVRVVAAVLTDRAAGKTGSAQNIQHVQRQGDSFRRIQLNRIRFFSGKKHHRSSFGSCCRTASGGITPTHELALGNNNILFHTNSNTFLVKALIKRKCRLTCV